MKKKLQITIAVLSIVLTCFAFKILEEKATSIKQVITDDFISTLFSSYYSGKLDLEKFPDTSVKYTFVNNTKNEGVAYAESQCYTSPAYLYYNMYNALDTNANTYSYFSRTYDLHFTSDFKKHFGKNILKERMKMKAIDYYRNPEIFFLFNGEAFQAAFDSLYRKPSETFKGLSMQKIYNATLKKYCRETADIIALTLKDKPQFDTLAANYMKKAKTDFEFNGLNYSYKATTKIFGEEYYNKYSCSMPSRIVSVMLRRQCDGSLPVLLKIFKKILKDYDPEFYTEVKDKF